MNPFSPRRHKELAASLLCGLPALHPCEHFHREDPPRKPRLQAGQLFGIAAALAAGNAFTIRKWP
jgi:hypothetical protein